MMEKDYSIQLREICDNQKISVGKNVLLIIEKINKKGYIK